MKRTVFNVPAAAGQYAPERIRFTSASNVAAQARLGVTALLEAGSVAGAVAEIWLPKVDFTPPGVDADFSYSGFSATETTRAVTLALASYPGCEIRVRSGGTSGTATVSASSD